MSGWKTIIVREEIYKLLEQMKRVENRSSISNMVETCVLYYFSKKHKDMKIVG